MKTFFTSNFGDGEYKFYISPNIELFFMTYRGVTFSITVEWLFWEFTVQWRVGK